MATIGFRIPDDWRAELEQQARKTGRSLSQVGADAIAAYLQKDVANSQAVQIQQLQLRLGQLEQQHRALAQLVTMQQSGLG
jgi:predicted transcriptional regulator